MPFARAAGELEFFWGAAVRAATAARRTEAAGAAYAAVQTADLDRLERETPPAPAGPPVQQLSADGALVPLVGGEWAEVKTLAIGEVTGERDADGEWVARTGALSYFARLADAEVFGRLATVETHRRGTATAGTVAAVVDGSEWLQGFIDLQRPDAIRILDFPHAAGYLGAAARATFGEGAPAAAAWAREQAHELKHGDPEGVLAALRALPVADAADPAGAARQRDESLAYLQKRRSQIDYARFRRLGLPIGSGLVESANKTVVEARLKGAGMRWARARVDPMVALRTVVCGDRWADAWPLIAR
jgi:hypothetical protein